MSTHWPCHSIHLQWSTRGCQAAGLARGPSLLLLPARAVPSHEVFKIQIKRGWGTKVPFCQLASIGHLGPGQGGDLPHWGIPLSAMFLKGDLPPGLTGLGKGAHLFAESPVQPTHRGDLLLLANWWAPPATPCTSSTVWMLVTAQSPIAAGLPMGDGVAQSLNMASIKAAATSTWWWASLATLRASLWDFCCLLWKWS